MNDPAHLPPAHQPAREERDVLLILCQWITARTAVARAHPERGASTVETVIIAAGVAAMAIATLAAISALVDAKVAGISL